MPRAGGFFIQICRCEDEARASIEGLVRIRDTRALATLRAFFGAVPVRLSATEDRIPAVADSVTGGGRITENDSSEKVDFLSSFLLCSLLIGRVHRINPPPPP